MDLSKKYLMYKGKPLVRFDNLIFYGNLSNRYVIMMQVLEDEPYINSNIKKATKVAVQLQYNSDDQKTQIVRETVKNSLYQAIEIATVWLERALKEV